MSLSLEFCFESKKAEGESFTLMQWNSFLNTASLQKNRLLQLTQNCSYSLLIFVWPPLRLWNLATGSMLTSVNSVTSCFLCHVIHVFPKEDSILWKISPQAPEVAAATKHINIFSATAGMLGLWCMLADVQTCALKKSGFYRIPVSPFSELCQSSAVALLSSDRALC